MAKRYVIDHECGWTSNPQRSPAQAAYSLRQHSCEKARRVAERRARGDAMRAAVDRTPKPCRHKIARHVHGTHACYVLDRCKCVPCAAANASYERHRQRQAAYGRWHPYVDAGPAREHVRALMAAGVGLKRIVKVSGVAHGTLWKLVYGKRGPDGVQRPSARIRWETAVKLLVVRADMDTLAGGARVDATGTQRRVQALVAAGWSQSQVCTRLGVHRGNFFRTMIAPTVSVRTAKAIAAIYDQLWDTPPPESTHRAKIAAARSRNYAAAAGWAPPLAWDEDTIDDPAAVPNRSGGPGIAPDADGWDEADAAAELSSELDEVLVERLMSGQARVPKGFVPPELLEAIARLARAGRNDAEIGELVGRTRTNVTAIRLRNEIPAGQPIDGIAARSTDSEAVEPAPGRRAPAA